MYKLCTILFLAFVFNLNAVSNELIFGKDKLKLKNTNYQDNSEKEKFIKYLNIKIDNNFTKLTENLFYNPPAKLIQSFHSPDTVIAINDGGGKYSTDVFVIKNGEIYKNITVKPGQGPTELKKVGSAVMVNDREIAIIGRKKYIIFDLSNYEGKPLYSLSSIYNSTTSTVRVGSLNNGFVIFNDLLNRNSDKPGTKYIYCFAEFRKHKIDPKVGFIRTGGYDIGQEEELKAEPLKLWQNFLTKEDMSFYLHVFNNCVSDGFKNYDFYFLDTINNSLLLCDTLNNKLRTYTSFKENKFKKMTKNHGVTEVLKVYIKDVKTNFIDGNVWVLHRSKEDKNGKPLPAYRGKKLNKNNLQEIDVLEKYLNYDYTIRIVPPKDYPVFVIESIAITGEHEGYVIARFKRENTFGLYFTRITF